MHLCVLCVHFFLSFFIDLFVQRVVGQDEAVRAVADAILRSRAVNFCKRDLL